MAAAVVVKQTEERDGRVGDYLDGVFLFDRSGEGH
jgi:hypothetical protein